MIVNLTEIRKDSNEGDMLVICYFLIVILKLYIH